MYEKLTWLAAVLVRPRRTMRSILERMPDRMVIPLILLTFVSSSLSDFDLREVRKALTLADAIPFGLAVTGGLLLGCLIVLILFYAFSWIAVGIGRLFEGQGRPAEVRSALAWGFAPTVWALLYRIPAVFLFPEAVAGRGIPGIRIGEGPVSIPRNVSSAACGQAIILGILEFVVLAWYLFVASQTLAEAHRFSGWRGLATLLVSLISPVILIIAAVLTIST